MAIVAPAWEVTHSALFPLDLPAHAQRAPPSWTPQQYKALTRAIVASPTRSIPLPEAERIAGPTLTGPISAVRSLVEHRFLHLRRYSYLARDLLDANLLVVATHTPHVSGSSATAAQQTTPSGTLKDGLGELEDEEDRIVQPLVMAPSPAVFYAMCKIVNAWGHGEQDASF